MTYVEFSHLSPLEQIRTLTAIIPNDIHQLTDRMAIINLITRVTLGDADSNFLDDVLKGAFGEGKGEKENES